MIRKKREEQPEEKTPAANPDVHERVAGWWDLSQPLPLPHRPPLCPVCRSDESVIRYWKFHIRDAKTGSPDPHRCDVSFKCTVCSVSWSHGVVVSKKYYDNRPRNGVIYAREGRQFLETKEGTVDDGGSSGN